MKQGLELGFASPFYHHAWFLLSIWPISSFWGFFEVLNSIVSLGRLHFPNATWNSPLEVVLQKYI